MKADEKEVGEQGEQRLEEAKKRLESVTATVLEECQLHHR